ncbi:uncharacterized protein BJ212DRAFT_1338269 [Suillus subaureus]|uniref:PUB domain-containing protein n=1 Tax=Suillus subaureus TaxID=48587 RepID=A0A9P7EF26_9AGAM|nr:uncharacterized protein BJ212DRAFT_1338269 [Suillus subaureus]KAG1820152.1 hypothetical protein BJ212DRAFT_1338269 [Suillus subaureus]
MSSETSPPPDPEFLAAAAQRRSVTTGQAIPTAELLRQHEERQKFRRLINPGISRPNSQEAAMASLKILSKISENLIREPENPKFRQFKPTNDTIRRHLIETKGALEYAIEMGFRPEVKEFQPLYVWNEHKSEELRLGAQILQETIELAEQKSARSQKNVAEAKAAAEAATQKALLAFMDDRKTKMLRDQRDRHNREVRAHHSPSVDREGATSPSSPPSNAEMPGSGHVLSSPDPVVDEPPPYRD